MSSKVSRVFVSCVITATAVFLFIVHFFLPQVKVDAIALFLFAFAVIPWLGRVFTKIELPGGMKFEYREFEIAAEEAKESGLIQERAVSISGSQATLVDRGYIHLLTSDPTLALAGLRIDLEQHLNKLASKRDIPPRLSLLRLVSALVNAEVINQRQSKALLSILRSLNGAAHGEQIDSMQAEEVMKVGQELLQSIELL
jgi:hypothetical protein